MAVRFVPKSDFVCADKNGRRRRFSAKHRRSDGTLGYLAEEVEGLYRDHLKSFRQVEMSGTDVVEQATQAPGEKRLLGSLRGHQCEECEFASKSAAGLAAHRRVHGGADEGDET